MLANQQAVVKDEAYWKNLIQQQITATPKLKPQESYEQLYSRISSELLQPIAGLVNINDTLSQSGSPALHTLAMQAESYEIIFKNVLTNPHIDVDKRDTLNATALHYATIYGHYDFVVMLIEKGCDIYAKTPQNYHSRLNKHNLVNNYSPFDYAVMKGYSNIAELLLTHEQKNGSEINRGRFLKQAPEILFKLACNTGNLELVKLLLRFGIDINPVISSWRSDELIYTVCQSGNLELVQLLIQQFPANRLTSNVLNTAASKAAQKGCSSLLRYLVNLGASIDLESAFSSQDKDTILTAISLSANINKAGRGSAKPLHLAAKFGNTEIIQTLLNRGAYGDLSKLTSNGETPLDFAIGACHAEAVRLLIKAGSPLYYKQQGDITYTALHQACLTNHLEIVSLVYELGGSQFINQQDQRRYTPLHYAVSKAVKQESNYDIVTFLLRKGANSNIGETPLLVALEHQNYPIAGLLIKYGANPVSMGNKRQTCLYRAARIRDIKFLELLLDNHIERDLHTKCQDYNSNGATPFLVAVSYGHPEHVKRLLREGANINDVNEDGDNCLHLLKRGYCDNTQFQNLINTLLENGAKNLINKTNKKGMTPVHSAAEQQDYSLMLLYIKSLPETVSLSIDKQLQQILAKNVAELRSQAIHDKKFKFFLIDQQSDLQDTEPDLVQQLVPLFAKAASLIIEAMAYSSDESNTELFKLILEKLPASQRNAIINVHLNINRSHHSDSEKNGKTLLFNAVKANRRDIVEILLKMGADATIACYCRDEFNKNDMYDDSQLLITPFALAVIKNNIELVKLFLENRAIRLDQHIYNKTKLKYNRYASSKNPSAEDSAIEHTLANGIELADKPELYTHIPLLFYVITNKYYEVLELLFTIVTSANLLARTKHYNLSAREISFLPELYATGVTALLYAIRLNDSKAVDIIVRNQATVNDIIEQVSPLLLAAICGDEGIVKILLAQGAEIEFNGKNGSTPLMLAVKANKLANAQVFLENGAKVDVANSEGITPLMLAVAKGYFSLVQLLVEFNADLFKITPKIILNACTIGNIPTITFLLERGFDPNACSEDGISYLMAATKFKHSEVIQVLIKAGADVNKLSLKGISALTYTIANADDKSFSILIKAGAKLQAIEQNARFYKLAEAAVINNNILVLQTLVNAGFNLAKNESVIKPRVDEPSTEVELSIRQVNNSQDNKLSAITNLDDLKHLHSTKKDTPDAALDHNLSENSRQLAIKNIFNSSHSIIIGNSGKFSLSAFDKAKDDNSNKNILGDNEKLAIKLLHIAAKEGYIEIIRFLIAAKANINAIKDSKYDNKLSYNYRSAAITLSPLHQAISSNQFDAAQVIIELGADINQAIDKNGANAIHLLLNKSEFGEQQQALLQLLVDKGANINQIYDCKDNYYPGLPHYKASPLYITYKNNNIHAMTLLLKAGAHCGLNLIQSGIIRTPLLTSAIEENNYHAVELLLLYGGLVLPNLNFSAVNYHSMIESIDDSDEDDNYSSEDFEDEISSWRLETPLHTAARKSNPDSALKILKYYPGLYNSKNKDGQTAEEVAISSNCMITATAIQKFAKDMEKGKKSNILFNMNLKFFKLYNENAKEMPFNDVEIFSTYNR